MSHIPTAAMKHATIHHPDAPPTKAQGRNRGGGRLGASVALGGALAIGVIAALALPLARRLRAPTPPAGKRRAGKRKTANA